MPKTFLEEASAQGFEQGWFDGLNEKTVDPRPALGIGLLDVDYLKIFKAAYIDGHATAKEELTRRQEVLMQARIKQREISHERGDA